MDSLYIDTGYLTLLVDYPVPIRRGRGQDSSPIPGSGTPAPGVTRGARAALGGSGFTAVNADRDDLLNSVGAKYKSFMINARYWLQRKYM